MVEEEGARWKAMRCKEDPELELSILAAARKFDLELIGELLETPKPKPKTWGANRSRHY